jgi:hypothetical protein
MRFLFQNGTTLYLQTGTADYHTEASLCKYNQLLSNPRKLGKNYHWNFQNAQIKKIIEDVQLLPGICCQQSSLQLLYISLCGQNHYRSEMETKIHF